MRQNKSVKWGARDDQRKFASLVKICNIIQSQLPPPKKQK